MKKITFFTFTIFAVLLLSILVFDHPKKFISRLIFSHDLSLLTHSVFYNINDEIDFDMTKKENQKKSLIVLNNYVYDFFKPVFNNLDDGVSWKMLHGSIWCDGVADILLRIAENTNTRMVMIFLYNNDGISPHTLTFADLDNSINHFNETELRKMYLFDPQNNYYPINKKLQFVNINYMLENKIEFSSYTKLDSDNIKLNLLQNNKRVFIKNRIYNKYSIRNQGRSKLISDFSSKIVKFLPKNSLKFLFKFGIFINPELDDDYKKFLYARLEHIFLNYDDAIVNYSKITDKNIFYDNAQYWYRRINSSQSVLKKYEDGKEDGKWTVWYNNVQQWYEGNYKDGKRDGKVTWWYENGQKRLEENYKDGDLDGKWTWWYEDGQIDSEINYKDGKRDGKYTLWYENGQKKLEENYKDGKLDGKYTLWYEDGQIEEEGNYKDGKRDGKYTLWYENGQKRLEENYKDGKRDGKVTWWHENGQIKSEAIYKDGKCISGDCD